MTVDRQTNKYSFLKILKGKGLAPTFQRTPGSAERFPHVAANLASGHRDRRLTAIITKSTGMEDLPSAGPSQRLSPHCIHTDPTTRGSNKGRRNIMPSMAMEHPGSAHKYASFARSMPTAYISPAQLKRQQERAALELEADEQLALVQKASTIRQIASMMVDQNERMLEGLRAVAAQATRDAPEKVDFVARNVAAVGARRSGLGRKEHALIARAEVMAAATQHLDGGSGGAPMPIRARRQLTSLPAVDSSADLVQRAREEVERGMGISALEQQTRRPNRGRR